MSLTSKNIFAALDTKKAKKKKSSEKSDKKKKSSDKKSVSAAELERQIFSQPSLSISNWADCDDEDEDIEPLPDSWSQPAAAQTNGPSKEEEAHDADESDEEVDLEQELGVELANDEEEDLEDDKEDQETHDSVADLSAAASAPVRRVLEPERQLSKKELKQKELDELSKVFEELGIAVPDPGSSEPADKKKKKDKKADGNGLHDLTPAASQGLEQAPASVEEAAEIEKKKKNKKKKEKPSETQEVSQPEEPAAEEGENGLENGVDESKLDPAQVAARLAEKKKKAAAAADAKKKLSAAALAEAKLRAKKLAKQKDTKHYNQAPQR